MNVVHPILVLALVSSLGACASTDPTPGSGGGHDRVDVTGHWKSDCLPGQNGQSSSLEFQIQAATWKLDYVTFGDSACASPFVTAHLEGAYEIQGPSAKVSGANEARFGFTTKTVTPHGAAAVQYLTALPACGSGSFSDGAPTDVLDKGCAGLGQYPGAQCPADFDLVAVQGDDLRFGARPADNDMCTADKRPASLAAFASHRAP
jgi:hypothetical protein